MNERRRVASESLSWPGARVARRRVSIGSPVRSSSSVKKRAGPRTFCERQSRGVLAWTEGEDLSRRVIGQERREWAGTDVHLQRIAALQVRQAGLVPSLDLCNPHPVIRSAVRLVLGTHAEGSGSWRKENEKGAGQTDMTTPTLTEPCSSSQFLNSRCEWMVLRR